MDLAELNTVELANEGVVMHVRGPLGPVYETDDEGKEIVDGDGKPVPVTITLLGDDSDRMVQYDREQFNEGLKGGTAITAVSVETKAINRLAHATVAWSGIKWEKQVLSLTPENARLIYRKVRWLRASGQQFVSDRANFSKASPTA
ncbi:hypothetical protein [Brevundimonas sp. FT23028]|uniref:hypothetical protein n=1 Tax=Brevundimonas sp. FT23028 TaxID=3393748 RepID=UPI003B586366